MEALLETQPVTLRLLTDVLAGAIDAHTSPQQGRVNHEEGEAKVITTMFRRCAAVEITTQDRSRSIAWLVGGSLFLAVASLLLQIYIGRSPFSEALLYGAFPAALMLSNQSTWLKRYSRGAQLTLSVGSAILVILFMWATVHLSYLI